ncbi:MAG TPA: hypothetical protein VNG53_09905 [Bacteroidia bacterium]|nr:hypothetical protein [Bacteroidia bacterium]
MEHRTNMYLLKYNLNTQKMEWKLKLYRSYRYCPGGNTGHFRMFVKNIFMFIYGAESNEDFSNVYPKLLKIKL